MNERKPLAEKSINLNKSIFKDALIIKAKNNISTKNKNNLLDKLKEKFRKSNNSDISKLHKKKDRRKAGKLTTQLNDYLNDINKSNSLSFNRNYNYKIDKLQNFKGDEIQTIKKTDNLSKNLKLVQLSNEKLVGLINFRNHFIEIKSDDNINLGNEKYNFEKIDWFHKWLKLI